MYQRDYILRLIEQAGAALRRLLAEIREQRPEEALETADAAVALVLDTSSELASSLTDEGLVVFLSAGGGVDVERAVMLAELLAGRADAFEAAGRPAEAGESRRRAAALLSAAVAEAGEEAVEQLRTALRDGGDPAIGGGEGALASGGDAT